MFNIVRRNTRLSMVFTLLLCTAALSAEDTQESESGSAMAGTENGASVSEPQIAYRILRDYASTQPAIDSENNLVSGVAFSVGGSLGVLGGAALGIWGDQIFPDLPAAARNVMVAGTIFDSGLLAAIGIGKLLTPPADYFQKYSLVFAEKDPIVQEALAAATLKDMARKSLETRVSQGVVNVAAPILSAVAQMIANANEGRPLGQNLEITVGVGGILMINGGISLFNKSAEELLYDKYIAARQALYSLPQPVSAK